MTPLERSYLFTKLETCVNFPPLGVGERIDVDATHEPNVDG